ncbi:DUF1513 domain-containing protein [Aureimonas pseudogalii]|uniref:DUF1513 domain-containing protein n=1 Tax=Aureimonas pseudogalii TaxID=1744844 RepID=A0A7W6EEA9_9HYPH|nr:DUF1513 domain-containing protein [Aureimonas pseudogalii]MBB3996209.1 hypothetical protein [Aureimonas pseudogalii]
MSLLLPLDRRTFLKAAGASFAAALAPGAAESVERADLLFASACDLPGGGSACAVFDEWGRIVARVDLPDRGHDVTFDPMSGRAVVFARRPSTFAAVFDPASGATEKLIASEPGRHFFGHGFFSPDGAILYATENDYDAARGLIGLYDARSGFRRIGEFETGGTDPHEALLMPDGETIVIANGGIETHPDFGRQKLNLATMEPSLVFIRRRDGTLLERHVLPKALHQLSIRHLAIDAGGAVWFGCQYEGAESDRPMLGGRARLGEELKLVDLDEVTLASLSNYVGSVACSRDGSRVAMASPRGNTVLVLETAAGTPLERISMREGCGLAPDRSRTGWIATGGNGLVRHLPSADAASERAEVVWDNHILAFA